MIDRLIIVIYVLLGVFILQAFLLAVAGRRAFGLEQSRSIPEAMLLTLAPDLTEGFIGNLKMYFRLFIGSALIDFNKTAKTFNDMSDEEHDALNARFDLWNRVLTEFVKPVLIARITKQVDTVDEYNEIAAQVAAVITREVKTKDYHSIDTNMVVRYSERIHQPVDKVAELVSVSLLGMEEDYIKRTIESHKTIK